MKTQVGDNQNCSSIGNTKMGKHKKVMCKVCYNERRSNHLTRHIKQHSDKDTNNPATNKNLKEKWKVFINCPRVAWFWCQLDIIKVKGTQNYPFSSYQSPQCVVIVVVVVNIWNHHTLWWFDKRSCVYPITLD